MIPFLKSLVTDQTRFVAVLGVAGSAALGQLGDGAPVWLIVAVPVIIAIGALPAVAKKLSSGTNS